MTRLVWTPEQSAQLSALWVARDQGQSGSDFDRVTSEMLGRSCDSIRQHRVKLRLGNGGRERLMPDDFTANFERMTQEQLRLLYATGKKTIKRWSDSQSQASKLKRDIVVRKAIHAACLKGAAVMKVRFAAGAKTARPKYRGPGQGVTWGKSKALPVPDMKADLVGMAMRHLMPIYTPVVRLSVYHDCNVDKRKVEGQFKVGRMTLTEAELMALAARKGFAVSAGFMG